MLLSKTKLFGYRMPIKQSPLTFAKSTATVKKQKITALPLDQTTQIIGHGITYFVIFYTTLNYLHYKSIQDDKDKD